MDTNTIHSDLIKTMEKRINQLESYFYPPSTAIALYQGEKVGVLISQPHSTDPLVYRVQYISGDKTGVNITAAPNSLTFLDPVIVTTQSYIQGLMDRIKDLEDKNGDGSKRG